jgi:serine/threonine-protein kinase
VPGTGLSGTGERDNGSSGTAGWWNRDAMAPPANAEGAGAFAAAFGTGQSGTGQSGAGFGTGQFSMGAQDNPGSRTLVVHREEAGRHLRGREPFLQRWLFSPRLGVIALILALGVGLGLGGWWLTAGRYAQVPSVAGDTVSQASAALTAGGFTVSRTERLHSNDVPKGVVVGTSPSGRAAKGSAVAILVSSGPFTSMVPKVSGDTLAAAQAALQRVHLVATIEKVGSDSPVGTVLGTDPRAGTTWPQTKPVAILVSDGAPLPDFVGRALQAAQQWAGQHGAGLEQRQDQNSQQPQGTITRQQPAPGSLYRQGETVTVEVSAGPQEVDVPNTIGERVQQATRDLQDAGFQVQVNNYGFGNRVFDFSPVGQAPRGSTVTLDVGL